MNPAKTQLRVARCGERMADWNTSQQRERSGEVEKFLTRRELAALLKVSVRTIDEMVAADEITPVRPHGPLVRFYVPHVVRELTAGKES